MSRALVVTIIFAITLFASMNGAKAGSSTIDVYIGKYIYNLISYIEWEKKKINFCIYGFDNVSESIIRKGKKNDPPPPLKIVKVLEDVKLNEILGNHCDVLYIARNRESDISFINEITHGKKIITISNIEDFRNKGGVMEILTIGRRSAIRVSINEKILMKAGIKLNTLFRSILLKD
jgi:hypothetical protein